MNVTIHELSMPLETDAKKEVNETMNDLVPVAKNLNSNQLPLSKKLAEIMKLINNVRQQLEDFSIERRTEVSQMQWMALEEFKSSSKAPIKPVKFWQSSLFARIYFTDKDLDEIFQNIMKCSSTFYQHLNQFNEKVMCCNNGAFGDNFQNVKLKSSPKSTIVKHSLQQPAVNLRGNSTKASKAATSMSLIDEVGNASIDDIEFIQQSLTNLIKAKIEFDSQFLHFNATLSKNCFFEDFLYLYKVCANSNIIMGQTKLSIEKRKSASSNNTKIRRKRASNNFKNKSQKRQLRKSMRLSVLDDSSEVQVIRNFKRREIT